MKVVGLEICYCCIFGSYIPNRKIALTIFFYLKKMAYIKSKDLFLWRNIQFVKLFARKSFKDFKDEQLKDKFFWTKNSMRTEKICRLVHRFSSFVVTNIRPSDFFLSQNDHVKILTGSVLFGTLKETFLKIRKPRFFIENENLLNPRKNIYEKERTRKNYASHTKKNGAIRIHFYYHMWLYNVYYLLWKHCLQFESWAKTDCLFCTQQGCGSGWRWSDPGGQKPDLEE